MNALNDVKSYMEFWGWTNGGNPGSIKHDVEKKIVAYYGDATWIDDVQRACDTLKRLADRVANPPPEQVGGQR
jgi:hypothetical protein